MSGGWFIVRRSGGSGSMMIPSEAALQWFLIENQYFSWSVYWRRDLEEAPLWLCDVASYDGCDARRRWHVLRLMHKIRAQVKAHRLRKSAPKKRFPG